MTELNLSNNQISDISPLAQLTQLTKLNLGGANQISDISPLAQLTLLTELDLSSNQISDITPLTQLTQLRWLLLLLNQISDISPIAQLKQLSQLYLSHNQISDVTPLAQLAETLTELVLDRNQIRDITPLAQLTYLENLDLQDNQIVDVTPLAQSTYLENLDLRDNRIRDVTPLAQLIYLEELQLRDNPITDTFPLSSLLDENPNLRIDIEVTKEEGEPTVTVSTSYPLTAVTLNGATVTLTLTSGVYTFDIADAITVSGIQGVTFGVNDDYWGWDQNEVRKVSHTEITLELAFSGTINADATLTFTVGPDAIAAYKGPALTAEIPVSATTEVEVTGELIASTAFPLTKETLNRSWVKLTLQNHTYIHGFAPDDAPVIATSGIPGVKTNYVRSLSSTEIRVQLFFNGNLDTDATLTFIVPPSGIKDYNGPHLAAALPVTVKSGRQVSVPKSERPSIYWINTDTGKIESIEPFDAVTNQVASLTVDTAGGKVYWSEHGSSGGTIKRANLDGASVEVLVTRPITPQSIKADTVGNKLYWINSLEGKIQSANLNGENIKTVIQLDDSITHIAVDAEGGKLYWADSQLRIRRMNLDGTNLETPLTDWSTHDTQGIGSIAIADGKIYWTEQQYRTVGGIYRADLIGTNIETLVIPLGIPAGIAVDTTGAKVYWTNSFESFGGIQRMDINGEEIENVIYGIAAPSGFALGTAVTQATPSTPADTDATVSISPSPVPSPSVGEQLTLSLNIADGENVAGYQATVQFDGTALRYISDRVGDYLPAGAFPLPAVVSGNTVTLAATSLAGESDGDGTLATITFGIIAVKESTLTLSDVILSDSAGTGRHPQVEDAQIVESPQLTGDINGDGVVNILDLVLVAGRFGQSGQSSADVNGDGIVNILDLVLVAGAFGNAAAAPSSDSRALAMLTATDVGQWMAQARQLDFTDATVARGILALEQLSAALTPRETVLLPNYPNPFNPETWIPYQLSTPSEVRLTVYSATGEVVQTLELGHQPAGTYQTQSRAAYWDGTNLFGETVASGIYFYTLTAEDFSATRKMLIRK